MTTHGKLSPVELAAQFQQPAHIFKDRRFYRVALPFSFDAVDLQLAFISVLPAHRKYEVGLGESNFILVHHLAKPSMLKVYYRLFIFSGWVFAFFGEKPSEWNEEIDLLEQGLANFVEMQGP